MTSAIQLVNERLGDPVESCSDRTIGAVACLIIYEVCNHAFVAFIISDVGFVPYDKVLADIISS